MNESINPLFIAGIVSFLRKPYTQSTQKPRAAPRCALAPAQEQRMPLAFEHIFAFQISQGDSGHPPAVCFFTIKENFCCHSAPSVAAPRSRSVASVTSDSRAASPQPGQD